MSEQSIERHYTDGESSVLAVRKVPAIADQTTPHKAASSSEEPPIFSVSVPDLAPIECVESEAAVSASPSLSPPPETLTPDAETIPDVAMFAPRPPPKPKAPIIPLRTENGFRTAGIEINPAGGGSHYITITPEQGPLAPQRIYTPREAFEQLLTIALSPPPESGRLWRALCSIPMERPLPSRQLEEELKLLLTNFAHELRR